MLWDQMTTSRWPITIKLLWLVLLLLLFWLRNTSCRRTCYKIKCLCSLSKSRIIILTSHNRLSGLVTKIKNWKFKSYHLEMTLWVLTGEPFPAPPPHPAEVCPNYASSWPNICCECCQRSSPMASQSPFTCCWGVTHIPGETKLL